MRPAPVRRPRTLAGVGLGRVLGVEVCALVIYATWPWTASGRAAVAVSALGAVPLLLFGLPGGRALERLGSRVLIRARRRRDARDARDAREGRDGRDAGGPGNARRPDDVLIRRFVDRAGVVHGVLHHDGCVTVVLAVEPGRRHPGIAAPAPESLIPLAELAAGLDDRGVRLAALRLVTVQVAAGDGGPAGEPVAGPPTRRRVYLAAALRPEDCPAAVASRGGGEDGAHRALASSVARLVNRLAGHQLRARVLDPPDALLALRTTRLTPVRAPDGAGPGTGPGVAGEETWTSWEVDGHHHVGFHVARWPRAVNPVAALAALTAGSDAVLVTMLTLRRTDRAVATMEGRLRLVTPAGSRPAAERALLESARALRLRLYRVDGRHRQAARTGTLLVGGS